jgi:tRNA-dihydrouridine synthase B
MKDLPRLKKLLQIVVKESSVPVTVKLRAGWDAHSINIRDAALASEDAGVSAVFVHGRTRTQEYSGSVDYAAIRSARESVRVPVIGSGDVFTPALAKKMFEETGCQGILVARGAFGNPWIFREIPAFLREGIVLPRPTADEVVTVMREHLSSCVDFYGPRVAVTIYRKFFSWYTRGFRGIRPLREHANRVKTVVGMEEAIARCERLTLDHRHYFHR